VNRVPRRFIDRLLSLVHPVHRYHCRAFTCNWEGNLRRGASDSDRGTLSRTPAQGTRDAAGSRDDPQDLRYTERRATANAR
jgi:hypothetical protein